MLLALALAAGQAVAAPTAVATADVTSGATPLLVHFDGSGSSTNHPSGNLTYAWDLDSDGQYDDSMQVQPSWIYEQPGTYTIRLRVRDDSLLVDATTLDITAGNGAPVPTILSPGSGDTWVAGQVVSLEGQAADPDEGPLRPAALGWDVRLRECASGACVLSPLASIDGATGSFVAPDAKYPAFLEVCLNAKDSGFPAGTTANWPYRKAITVDPAKVFGNQPLIDFPLLVKVTDPDLRSMDFGGGVGTLDGRDIVFATPGVVKLAHEIEHYDPRTGNLVAWVRVPVLFYNVATQLFVHYGNPTVPPQANPQAVWSSRYAAVWHLNDAPADLDLVEDSTLHGLDGVFHDLDGNSDGAATGWIGGGLELSGVEDHVDLGVPTTLPEGAAPRSLCGWARANVLDSYRWLASYGSPVIGGAFFVGAGLFDELQAGGFGGDLFFSPFWNTTSWHHVCVTYTGATGRLYGDGLLRASQPRSWYLVPGKAYLGRQVNDLESWSGGLDEIRIANEALSSVWIATEYANQSSPASFYALGVQEYVPTALPIGDAPLTATTCLTMSPATVALTFETEPVNLDLIVDGKTETAPFQRTAIIGSSLPIEAPSPQTPGQIIYYWGGWSDGGALAHEIVVPAGPTTYTATYPVIGIGSLLNEMIDLKRLAEPLVPPRRERLASSYDRVSAPPCDPDASCWFANDDWNQFVGVEVIEGRTEYVMMDAAGPGAIEHIWAASPSGTLRIYIDGASEPALEQSMSDLLAGSVFPFVYPLAHEALPGIAGNLYFPIPYATHCKVTVEDVTTPFFYYRVAYREYLAPVGVESFSMERALAQTARIAEVASVLSNPWNVYQPSPEHLHLAGTIGVNQGPLIVSPSGLSSPHAIVRELRLRLTDTSEASLRGTLLTISFDGRQTVSAPFGDFFGSGPGLNIYESLPFSIQGGGTMISRWPMPFQQGMSIEVTSEDPTPPIVFYEVFLEPYTFGPDTLSFHASWRRDYEVYSHGAQDWNYVAVQGRGHYVGDVLNVTQPFLAWWGEGDEKIVVDGESFPGQFGVGTEDYYGFGWATTAQLQFAYHAQTRAEGTPGFNLGHASMNRWRVFDSVPFQQEFRFDLEQLFDLVTTDDRRPLYDVVTYYYAGADSTNNHPPLSLEDLEVPAVPPLVDKELPGIILEGEEMSVLVEGGLNVPQLMQAWEVGGLLWSGHFQRLWLPDQQDGGMRLGFDVASTGEYCMLGYMTRAPGSGVFDLGVDDEVTVSGLDLTGPSVPIPSEPIDLGVHDLLAGTHEFSATLAATGPGSSPNLFGLDAISLISLSPSAGPLLSLDREGLSWTHVTPEYDIVAGDLGLLRSSGGDFAQAITGCLADHTPDTNLPHTSNPAAGGGWFFLVRGNHCAPGSFDSGTATQQGSRDEEILASPNACP